MLFAPSIQSRIDALAGLTDDPPALTRLYLSPAHARAMRQLEGWMREAGMTVRRTALGDLVGRYEGIDAGQPALVLGSHIDTVRNAGRYDGTLGVLAGLAVAARLHGEKRRLPFAVEVIAFGDEEGSRFPGTLTGSRAMAGRFNPAVLDDVDANGITRWAALKRFGCDPSRIEAVARKPEDILGFLEVHIEQGPWLETIDLPVAVVTAISGASRGIVEITGMAGHAGTVPMSMRQDALTAAAEMILEVERRARADAALVATVGQLSVTDAATNTIAGRVAFSLDIRSAKDEIRHGAIADLKTAFAIIAESRKVAVTFSFHYEAPAVTADAALVRALSAAVAACGHRVELMASGAGHDAMVFAGRFPFAMLFVRCRGGLSHHPNEFTTMADIEAATSVLWRVVTTWQLTATA